MMHTFVLVLVVSLSACSFASAEDDSLKGKIHTQEGSICEWSRVDYVKGAVIQRFHLDCTCKDEVGEDSERYSCTYEGNLKKCLTSENDKRAAQETRLFRDLSIEAREQDHACVEDMHIFCEMGDEMVEVMMSLDQKSKINSPKDCATHYRPHNFNHEEL